MTVRRPTSPSFDDPLVAAAAVFQVMPPLSAEEYAALRDDIAERGIVVPVVVDQHGRLLDGHHRRRIADELGIDCPVEVHQVTDDEDARQVALTLNLTRRHLSREQRRELIAREAAARPGDSDRAIARRLGCSPTTVAAVRRPVSNLDTPPMTRAEAEDLTRAVRALLTDIDQRIEIGLAGGVNPLTLIEALTATLTELERLHPGENIVRLRELFEPRIDALMAVAS